MVHVSFHFSFLPVHTNWKRFPRETINDDWGQITEELLPNTGSFGKMLQDTQYVVRRANVCIGSKQKRFVMVFVVSVLY